MPREMKDSGIGWVGAIPSDWKTLRGKFLFSNEKEIVGAKAEQFERLALTLNGVIKRSKEDNEGLQPDKFDSYQILRKDELVFKLIDLQNISTSRVGLSSFTGIVSPAYIVLKPKSAMISSYAEKYFLMMWMNQVFNALGDAGVRSSLNASELLEISLPCPSINEQHLIADFLDSKCAEIDALSADIQKQIEKLEEYKRSVITEAVTKGLDPNVEMKDSGVEWCPRIPVHWTYSNPKALFSQRFDRAKLGERQLTASQEHGIVYQDEYMKLTGNKVVTVMKDFNILKHVEPGDFVISMRSFQGGLEFSTVKGCISSAYVMLIPNETLVYPPFYKWFFKSSKYINALQSTSNLVRDGQAMRYANFAQVPLFIIPLAEQKGIADYLDKRVSQVNEILMGKQEQLNTLLNYKKSVIYEYVTGKKEVPVIE